MAINKVVLNTTAGAQVLIDLTMLTVTPETLAEGVIAMNAAGELIVGTHKCNTIVNYTNLVPTAQAVDSTAVYTGTGYKDGYRLSSSEPYETAATGYVATGLMPYSVPDTGVPGTIYIKGADWSEVSNCRLYFYNASKVTLTPYIRGGGTGTAAIGSYYTVETLGDQYYKLTPIANPDSSSGSWIGPVLVAQITNAAFFRFSLAGSGSSSLVITVDEPIE